MAIFILSALRTATMFNLLSSKLYNEDTFYKAFLNDLGHCHKEVTIERRVVLVGYLEILILAHLRGLG